MNKFLVHEVWLSAALVTLSACSLSSSEKPRDQAVKRGTVLQRVAMSGLVIPNRKLVVSPPYNGYVRKIFVKVGDRVKPGDPLITISPTLGGGDEVYPIRTPFAGTVVQVLCTEGEYLEASSQAARVLLRVDDLSRLFVEADAPEIEVVKLREGQEVQVRAPAVSSAVYIGRIRHVSLAAREKRGAEQTKADFPVSIELTQYDANLKPGMSVIIDVITQRSDDVLYLPHEYVDWNGPRASVMSSDGRRLPVETGIQSDEWIEIRSGLNEGDRVLPAGDSGGRTGL